jgi:phosphoribosylformylglycinamidine cyclo-ligase
MFLEWVHITGGGFQENINRILPDNTKAMIDIKAWKSPALFTTLQEMGKVPRDEMYRTFNMGIGYVVVVKAADAAKTLKMLPESIVIGQINARQKNRTPSRTSLLIRTRRFFILTRLDEFFDT